MAGERSRSRICSLLLQVREVAAQALSSMLSPHQALRRATTIEPALDFASGDQNAVHGHLLLLGHLIADVIEWDDADVEAKRRIEVILLDVLRGSSKRSASPLIVKSVLDCILAYHSMTSASPGLTGEALETAQNILLKKSLSTSPGYDLLLDACVDLVLSLRPSPETLLALFSRQSTSEEKIAALERLGDSPQAVTAEIFERVLASAISRGSGDDVQIAALDILAGTSTSIESKRIKREGLCKALEGILEKARCVPLREAALPALGRSIAWVRNLYQNRKMTRS